MISTPRLTVPHPLFHVRAFALRPVCEVAGDMVHPVLGVSVEELCRDVCGAEETEKAEAEDGVKDATKEKE